MSTEYSLSNKMSYLFAAVVAVKTNPANKIVISIKRMGVGFQMKGFKFLFESKSKQYDSIENVPISVIVTVVGLFFFPRRKNPKGVLTVKNGWVTTCVQFLIRGFFYLRYYYMNGVLKISL